VQSLASLDKGFRFTPFRLDLDPAAVRRYLNAVSDSSQVYDDGASVSLTPPLAIAAFALREMLAQVELPAGAVHSGQEIGSFRAIPVGSTLHCEAVVSQRSVRAGWVAIVVDFEASDPAGGPVLFSARTSVLSPQEVST
jgi:hypothetical protein